MGSISMVFIFYGSDRLKKTFRVFIKRFGLFILRLEVINLRREMTSRSLIVLTMLIPSTLGQKKSIIN